MLDAAYEQGLNKQSQRTKIDYFKCVYMYICLSFNFNNILYRMPPFHQQKITPSLQKESVVFILFFI